MGISTPGTEVVIEKRTDDKIVEMLEKFRTAHPEEALPEDLFEIIAPKYQTTIEHVRELAAQQTPVVVKKPTPTSPKKSPKPTLEEFAQGVAATIKEWKTNEREELLEVRDSVPRGRK